MRVPVAMLALVTSEIGYGYRRANAHVAVRALRQKLMSVRFAMAKAYFDESLDILDGVQAVFARSSIALSIADYTQPDCPLVGINDAFLKTTGYDPEQVLHLNCRFLQPDGDPGPVRYRMRRFIQDPEEKAGRFLIPNVSRDGRPFLNLLYLTKLTQNNEPRFILGSQFDVSAQINDEMEAYDLALTQDLSRLNLLTNETNWVVLGSLEAIASSHSIIAQSKIE